MNTKKILLAGIFPETRDKMAVLAAENIIEYYKNKRVPHIINPHALRNT